MLRLYVRASRCYDPISILRSPPSFSYLPLLPLQVPHRIDRTIPRARRRVSLSTSPHLSAIVNAARPRYVLVALMSVAPRTTPPIITNATSHSLSLLLFLSPFLCSISLSLSRCAARRPPAAAAELSLSVLVAPLSPKDLEGRTVKFHSRRAGSLLSRFEGACSGQPSSFRSGGSAWGFLFPFNWLVLFSPLLRSQPCPSRSLSERKRWSFHARIVHPRLLNGNDNRDLVCISVSSEYAFYSPILS